MATRKAGGYSGYEIGKADLANRNERLIKL